MTESNNLVDLSSWPDLKTPKSKQIPYGYKEGGDPTSLVPDPDQVILIEQYLDKVVSGMSLRLAAQELSELNQRPITHVGLSKILERRRGSLRELRGKPKKKLTREERSEVLRRRKLSAERRRITLTKQRIQKLEGLEPETKQEIKLDSDVTLELEIPEEINQEEVIFKPNPGPQELFLSASEKEVLYGGAAGGGKSFAMIADPIRYFTNPNFRGLLLRRTNDELRELIWSTQKLYPQIFKKAKWSSQQSTWTFPSGATFWLSYLERDEDVLRYQGQSFTWIGIDELTQYATPHAWTYMSTRLRSTDPDLPTYMRATTNPGGPGHAWVKKMFIDPAPHGKPFYATDLDTGEILREPNTIDGRPNPKAGQPLKTRRFIPSSIFDNPYLRDTDYVQSLLAMPEHLRRQLLEGDWSISEGAAFPEFRISTHVVEPFDIPKTWTRFRSCDYGYGSHSAVHWYAMDPAYDTIYVYRELYVSKATGEELARLILDEEYKANERVSYGVLDSSVWHNRGFIGPSIAETMIANGCKWRPADRSAGSRVHGRIKLHQLLKERDLGDRKIPGIVFFDTCRQIIQDLQSIPTDPKGGDDIDVRYKNDHAYDSIRYGIMSRPRSSSIFDSFSEKTYKPHDPIFGY